MRINLLLLSCLPTLCWGNALSDRHAVENKLRSNVIITNVPSQQINLLERMALYKVPAVSIAVIKDGKVAWENAYGTKTVGGESVTIDNLFQAGSVSKTLTAYGVLILAEQHKIDLDEDINQYLKSWKIEENKLTQNNKVTLRRLLSHSAGTSVSGFPGYAIKSKLPTTVEILEGENDIVNTDPVRVILEPGTRTEYSGGGTTIVQLLIEDVSGQKFEYWMQENVLLPLGMTASTFKQPTEVSQNTQGVFGHTIEGALKDGPWHVYPEMAAAGLWTKPADLAKFMLALLKGGKDSDDYPLKAALVQEMLSKQIMITDTTGAGLGVFLEGKDQNLTFQHDGGTEGFITRFKAFPAGNVGMIIMINCHFAWDLMQEIDNSISDVYQIPGSQKIYKEIKPIKVANYPEITGKYSNEDDSVFFIKKEQDELYLSFNEIVWHKMYLSTQNSWFIVESDMALSYESTKNKFTAIYPENVFRGELMEDFVKE